MSEGDRRVVRPSPRREVDEELAFHVEMRVRELTRRGWPEAEARAEAVRRFGDIERVKAQCRELGKGRDERVNRQLRWDGLRQDFRYALRQLWRAPGFSAVTVLTLALAIGATTAVFTVVNGVALRPLPFPDPDRLAVVWSWYGPPSGFDIDKFAVSGPEWLDYREETEAFASLGAYTTGSRTLTGDGNDAERLAVAFVSVDVLPTLGIQPLLGRWIGPEDDAPGGPAVALLGHGLWTSRFGADPSLVGRTVPLNGVPTEVVGIMPEGFDFPSSSTAAWLPLGIDRSNAGGRGGHGLGLVGRLAPGKELEDARTEIDLVGRRWAQEYEHNRGHWLWTQSLKAEVVADAPQTLLLLMSAVGLVLLVACVNVANLLFARAERRQTEVAVRGALGADRGRIAGQLVTESAVLAIVAAALGLALSVAGVRGLTAAYPDALPRLDGVGIDLTVLGFTLAATASTVLLFGVAPAVWAGKRATAGLASSAVRSVGGRRTSTLRRLLVSGEVAVSLTVVILAALVVRTFSALVGTDPGLDPENLLTFAVTLPPASYPDAERLPAEWEQLMDRLRPLPGVRGVAAASYLPFSGARSQWDFQLDDRPPRSEGDLAWNTGVTRATAGYFRTAGIPILEGRGFDDRDGIDAPLVAVVSESMAERYWPGESALGKRFGYTIQEDSVPWMTVVGVVADPVRSRVDEDPYPHVYIPHAQSSISAYDVPRTMTVAIRTGIEPGGLVAPVRRAVAEHDPDLALFRVRTMEDQIALQLSDTRAVADLLSIFAAIALVLAAVGVYGVVSYSVAGRTREIGVRVALGADRSGITTMILAEGLRPVLVGVVLGLAGAWLSTRLVESMLYGVDATDPLTFTTLPLGLLAIGALASLVPALRATRIAPTEALREE